MCMYVVLNMVKLGMLIVWMQITIPVCILTEVMGTSTPRWLNKLHHRLKQHEWYRYKHVRKRTKCKGCKRYKWRMTTMLLSVSAIQPMAMLMETNDSHFDCSDEFNRDEYALTVTNHMRFEIDSVPIKVDNCCTQTITGYMSDFIPGTVKPVSGKQVRGFGQTTNKITHKGTIRWSGYDDIGKHHDIIVTNSYYVPDCAIRLLSPQHWAQERNDNYPNEDGTYCTTYKDCVELYWNQRKTVKTMEIDANHNNVATMWTIGSNKTYNKAMKFAQICEAQSNEIRSTTTTNEVQPTTQETSTQGVPESEVYEECETDKFDNFQHLGRENVVIRGTTSTSESGVSAEEELMRWHVRFGHMLMSRIQSLASEGVLPRRLVDCKVPICPGCMYGKLTRQLWRVKNQTSQIAEKATHPGECVSVDQMISTIPGLIAQLKGIPTRQRYQLATIFVDHASDYTFVHFQTSASSLETVQAKQEFERHASGAGVTIKRYHCDNGRFVDNLWTKDMKLKNQEITLCGTYAHHQNGKVEKRIRDLQELARTSLLHAKTRWPDAVNSFLWPYAVRKGAVDFNTIKKKTETLSPLEKFSNVKVQFQPRHHHTFGCPMYVLDTRLQSGSKVDKWESRSRMTINLGTSMNHAANVGLALSLMTGLVSPVFHAKYDDQFETVAQAYGRYIPKSQWQVRCGFVDESTAEVPIIHDQFMDNEQVAMEQHAAE
jgi:GAG-pre-integrase domain